jgi:hypothetical protein
MAQRTGPPSNSAAFGAIGIAAYENGDYETARYWLQSAVYDFAVLDPGSHTPDPWATLYLARMHYFGEGLERDITLACSLYETAARANEGLTGDSLSRAKFRRILGADPCPAAGPFSTEELRALHNGCFWPGLSRAEFAIDNGSLTIEHGLVEAQVGEHHWESVFVGFNGCQTIVITPFGHLQVRDPAGRSARDFVHLFVIEGTREGAQIVRTLRWYLWEVIPDQLRIRTAQSVERLQDVRTPALVPRPELLDDVALRAGPDGTLEWALPAWHLAGSLRVSPQR